LMVSDCPLSFRCETHVLWLFLFLVKGIWQVFTSFRKRNCCVPVHHVSSL
jgi:hypothetical protein